MTAARILVVEDVLIVATDIQSRLAGLGYQTVGIASDGMQAIALAGELRPDLVLMDILLDGEMDGIQAAEQIHQRFQLPVVFLTAYSEDTILERSKIAGPFGYILKPFQDRELKVTIEIALYMHRAEEEIRQLNAELEQRVEDRTAELRAANQELEAFSHSVSHDLRAPLRAINGFASILREDHAAQLDSEGLRILEIVASEGRRMGLLVDDLIAFSRLGRQPLQRCHVDMETLAGTVFAELAGREPGRTLRLSLEPIPPAFGDLVMLRQVWVNLLANAIKYTRTREVAQISIGSRMEGGEIRYFVQDNGIGFDMQHVGQLFGVFHRLHGGAGAELEGTGVGLAMTQRILRRHGGRVWADARINAGATFFFALPHGGST